MPAKPKPLPTPKGKRRGKRSSGSQWTRAKAEALRERGGLCENCGLAQATDFHHCLIPRQKRFSAWLDNKINGELVCRICHTSGEVDTLEHRKEFHTKQLKRYGKSCEEWMDNLPEKLKITHRLNFATS
jgi:RecJ-like exonuclease